MSSSIMSWLSGPHIFEFDYASQLEAARELLGRNRQADTELSDEIKDVKEWASKLCGDENGIAIIHTIDLIFQSTHQKAAHSMAAVGVIAPVIEAAFKDAINRAGKELPRGDLVKHILKVVDQTGMVHYLPDDLPVTLEALFRYRNKLFHWGFEWPPHIRKGFQETMNQWPSIWFDVANLEVEYPVFIMSPIFIDHCLQLADDVVQGLQEFLIDRARKANGLEPLGRGQRRMRFVDLPEWGKRSVE